MKLFFEDAEFDNQLRRMVRKTCTRCTEVGECLAAALGVEAEELVKGEVDDA